MTLADQTDAESIGDYRLVRIIGEGGMGVVHLAQAPDGSRVALKVLRPQVIGDPEARERLAREVTALSRVTSPRVAEILDADPWGPQPFVVTRYVPGPSLLGHVRDHGPIADDDLRPFATGLVEALAAVHRVGVLHRDVKPGNVLVHDGQPVLIDFGLALMAEDPRLTATGYLLGTPGYLAPEVLYGDEPTPAADVHAWAATVVFAATGHPPAGRGPAMAILDRVRRGEFDLTGVPDSVLGLIRRSLATDPLDRPGVPELLAELGGRAPAEPAPEPTVRLERTRVLAGAGADEAATSAEPDVPALPEQPRRARRTVGLLGVGAAVAGSLAWAPYVAAIALAVVVALLRFASVTRQRHVERRMLRGRPRWYDVPASAISSPAYLVFSLVGTVVLLLFAAAAAAATLLVVLMLNTSVATGMTAVAIVGVLALWWGPAADRVREMTRRAARPLARPTRTAPVVFVLGVFAGVLLVSLVAGAGPWWAPTSAAPWTHDWLGRIGRLG